jgi:acyl-coenzyme A thioesterase 9
MPVRSPQLWVESLRGTRGTPAPTRVIPEASGHAFTLLPRPMSHSYSEVSNFVDSLPGWTHPSALTYRQFILPFASDPAVLEQYTNARGGIRTGKLMEDLDSLAGGVAYKHLMEPGVSKLTGSVAERGFYVVTASVDR